MPKIENAVKKYKKPLKFPIPLKQEGPYSCDCCGFECPHRNSIYGRLKYFHFRSSNNSILKRAKLSELRNRRSLVLSNIVLNHPGSYFCDKCGRAQKNRNTFLRHLSYMHGTKNQFHCDLCRRSFMQKHKLAYHLQRTHFTIKQIFKCPDCDKEFRSRNVMRT